MNDSNHRCQSRALTLWRRDNK